MGSEGLESRVVRTARIADRRGFCFHHEDLARWLHGGPGSPAEVARATLASPRLSLRDGFVALRGRESLVALSRRRREAHSTQRGVGPALASEFARRLAADCPFVRSVALCGSHATGGAVPGDDVDVNLLVEDGTKFVSYSVALLHASRHSLTRRARKSAEERVGPFPKVVCVNAVYEESQTRPFSRRDEQVAFEFLASRPVFGAGRMREMLEANPWLLDHFPQIAERFASRVPLEAAPPPSRLGRAMGSLNGTRDVADAVGYVFARLAHGFADASRRGDPVAAARREFLRSAKHPYDVLDRVEVRR
jgi:hypothetical protein